MWRALRADARFYHQLRHPGGGNWLTRALIWVTSRGLIVLMVHRLNFCFVEAKRTKGWTPHTVLLRALVGLFRMVPVLLAKAELLGSIPIGGGVYLSDRGNLIVGARGIGQGTIIHHCVTIGMSLMDRGKPMLGTNVWIGPNCVIYGSIDVGDGATILPGTVLTKSIPARTVVKGNPARVLSRDFDNRDLRASLEWDVDPARVSSS